MYCVLVHTTYTLYYTTQGGAICGTNNSAVTIDSCTFTRNSALMSAGAIFGAELSIPTVTASIFSQNSASCCFAQGYGSSAVWENTGNTCIDVDSGTALTAECCTVGAYTDGVQCVACDSSAFDCTALGISAVSVPLQPGLWRADLQTLQIYECWNREACTGGRALTSVTDYCAEGYTGPCKLHVLM
jgi:hypothetical protein